MAYLGTPPQSGFITTAKQRVTSSTNNYVDLDHSISSIADVIVFVNFVKQDTTNLSLTTSTRITLGGTLVSSDIVEIHYLGKAVNTQTVADGTLGLAKLSATGTKSSSTFLRGDNTFATAGISGVTSSSSSTALSIDANGHVTKPLQSCFMGTIDYAGGNNCTGDGTTVILGSSDATVTERFDQNGDFASNTFTAPVTGRYQLNVIIYTADAPNDLAYFTIRLVTSNREYYAIFDPGQAGLTGANSYHTLHINVLADMDASDTAKVRILQNNGTAQTDIDGGVSDTPSNFSGYLVA